MGILGPNTRSIHIGLLTYFCELSYSGAILVVIARPPRIGCQVRCLFALFARFDGRAGSHVYLFGKIV